MREGEVNWNVWCAVCREMKAVMFDVKMSCVHVCVWCQPTHVFFYTVTACSTGLPTTDIPHPPSKEITLIQIEMVHLERHNEGMMARNASFFLWHYVGVFCTFWPFLKCLSSCVVDENSLDCTLWYCTCVKERKQQTYAHCVLKYYKVKIKKITD